MTTFLRTLEHDDLVRMNTWTDGMTYGKVGTIEGTWTDGGRRPLDARFREYLAKCEARGDDLAFVTFAGRAITDSRDYYDRERKRAAAAIVLMDGEAVLIRGKLHLVRVVPGNERSPRNCDPIKFVPI